MPRPLPEASGSIGNFMSKPARGWLHPDQLISKKGVTYAVRYIGCLEVNTSMKSLDFDTRFQVAKECINRVCEAASLKTADKKRKVDKRVARSIGEQPLMEHAGANVKLNISSTSLSLRTLDSGQVVATHDMPRISFASGGDVDTLDFVAYVAKDLNDWRACYVLECGGGLAQDVITTVGQAFELRFKQFLTLPSVGSSVRTDDREYYNDLPGKVPPDVGPPPVPPLPNASAITHTNSSTDKAKPNQSQPRERLASTNLIDLNCDIIGPPQRHDYVNDIIINSNRSPRDVFDMQPFVSGGVVGVSSVATSDVTEQNERSRLQSEAWFHGSISRPQAELLLKQDGDFLVRESQGSAGQYVLTGLQGGVKKHLLLIDPEGVVHLPRNQLYVARVSPKTRLADILLQVCSEKNLDPLKYSLRHPSNLDKVLSLSCSLADYKLQEVTLVCNRSHPVEVSTVDIMSLQRETSNPAYRSTMCEGSVSSGSLEGRSLSPVPSDESSASPPPLPPSRPTRKRRPAPKPPTTNQKVLNEEKQQNGIQPSTLIYHSRNSSDSSGYHEASVLSESPQSNNGPEVLLQSKMASVSEGTPVSREAALSQSMTDVTVIESSLHQATSYSSITSLSSITGRKKKTAPPPPVATNRASSLIEDQQRTPSVSSTASSTTTLDGNEVNVAVKSATLPPSSRLNIVPKKLSPPSSPTPTTKVDVVEPPVTTQVAPAPRPRSKLFIDPEQVSWQILSDSATRGKLPSPKKLPAPQPKPRQLLLSSKSVDNNKITEIIETPIEGTSTTQPELTHKKLLRSKFGSHQAYIEELTLKLERRGSESSESRVVEVQNQDAIENQDVFIWNDINSSPVRNSSSNVDVSKPVEECEQQMSGEKPPADQAPAWVVEPNSGVDESTSDIKEIDRIFASAIENHTSFEFGAEEDQIMSLPALPSPPSSLIQCELKQSSQSDEPLDWEYRLPAPPTFRDEARSPSLTEFGTMTLGDFNETLCSETVKQDNLNKTDVQKIIECEERMKEDNVLIDTVKLKSYNNEINDISSITKEKTVASIPKQQISSSFGDFENEILKDLTSKQCVLEPLEKNVINELVSTLSVKPSKVEISDIENKQFSQELSSSSTLDNFTITTYKDTKPVEVFEDDSIKSSVGEKRDKSKDDAVFRAPKHRIKEPKLSRTSSFSMESNLNGPLIKRSVSYVSLLAANMPRNSQPYRAHLMRQHSCASKDSQDLWPRLRKTSSEVNIDIKDGTTKETSFWQDDPSELQSVQVLRNILSRSQASLASSLDETDDLSHLQQRDPPISEQRLEDTFDQSSDGKKWGRSQSEEVSSSINWVPKTRMVHSASLDQEQTKPITNIQRGQPSINLSTWSERPKRLISLKNDCDYTSGFGKKNTAQDDGTAGAKNKDSISSAKIVHSTNNSVRVELTSKNEVFKVDGRSKSTSDLSRIPIVRAVELKKPFAVNNFDRVSLKPVQSLDDRKNNSPTKSDEVTNNSDESFIGVNSLARKFGVPQKRPVSLYVNSNSKINDLHAEIETFKPLKNTVHHSGNKFPEVDSASKMGENVFRVNKKVERYNESQIKISALHNKTDSTTSEIKALAKIRSGGFVEDTPIVSSLKGLNHSEKSRAPLNSYLSRHEENVSDTDSLTINATVSNGNSITSIGDSKSPVVPNVSVVSSSTQRGVSSSVFVRQNQTLDRKARPLSLQPVVKGFRVQTEAISKPTKDLTLHSSPPPKTKDLTISSASLSNNKTSSDDFVTKSMYHRALSTPSISLFSSTSIKEAAKDKNTEKVDLEPLYQKVTSQTVPPPPPPPPELPVLKPVGDRKNVKLLPPPQAKPRDQLMQSIRSFGIDGLKKVSK